MYYCARSSIPWQSVQTRPTVQRKDHQMRKQFLVCVSLVCALLLLGCYKESTTNRNSTAPANSAEPAKPAATTATTTTASAEKVGVPECDDYIAKYEACVSGKVPEAARAQYKTSIDQMRKSWQTLAANPQTKASLAAACKTAADQARVSMKSFGCAF